jgi:hypothetical protein
MPQRNVPCDPENEYIGAGKKDPFNKMMMIAATSACGTHKGIV